MRMDVIARIRAALPHALFVYALIAFGYHIPRARTEPAANWSHHFAPEENLERLDVAEIARAARTIDAAAYVLTDVAVIDALADAARRGVKVRIYRDGKPIEAGETVDAALARLAQSGAEIRYKSANASYMHLKAYCVDGAMLRTGAANFSASGEKMQDNDAIFLRGPNACAAFDAHFDIMWGR